MKSEQNDDDDEDDNDGGWGGGGVGVTKTEPGNEEPSLFSDDERGENSGGGEVWCRLLDLRVCDLLDSILLLLLTDPNRVFSSCFSSPVQSPSKTTTCRCSPPTPTPGRRRCCAAWCRHSWGTFFAWKSGSPWTPGAEGGSSSSGRKLGTVR